MCDTGIIFGSTLVHLLVFTFSFVIFPTLTVMETLSIFPEYTVLFTEGAERKKKEKIIYVCKSHLTLQTLNYLEHILKVLTNIYLTGLPVP